MFGEVIICCEINNRWNKKEDIILDMLSASGEIIFPAEISKYPFSSLTFA